jgi:hypothetical protein
MLYKISLHSQNNNFMSFNSLGDAVLFVSKLDDKDIICFIDDSSNITELCPNKNLVEIFGSFDKRIIFGKRVYKSFFHSYQNKKLNTCLNTKLDQSSFMGYKKEVLNVLLNGQIDDDSFIIACETENISIDNEQKLFYNYIGEIDSNKSACISRRNKLKVQSFIQELFLFVLLGIFITNANDKALAIALSMSVISIFIEWHMFIKRSSMDGRERVLYTVIDYIHCLFYYISIYLILTFRGEVDKLIFLNIMGLSLVTCFLSFRRCFLTIFSDNISSTIKSWIPPFSRIGRFFDPSATYIKGTHDNYDHEYEWISSNIIYLIAVLLLNIYTFIMVPLPS